MPGRAGNRSRVTHRRKRWVAGSSAGGPDGVYSAERDERPDRSRIEEYVRGNPDKADRATRLVASLGSGASVSVQKIEIRSSRFNTHEQGRRLGMTGESWNYA